MKKKLIIYNNLTSLGKRIPFSSFCVLSMASIVARCCDGVGAAFIAGIIICGRCCWFCCCIADDNSEKNWKKMKKMQKKKFVVEKHFTCHPARKAEKCCPYAWYSLFFLKTSNTCVFGEKFFGHAAAVNIGFLIITSGLHYLFVVCFCFC